MKFTVINQEEIVSHELKSGGKLDEILLELGYIVERQCAGNGTCGRCRIKAVGDIGEATELEMKSLGEAAIKSGLRLACQAIVRGVVEVVLPDDTPHTDKIFGKAPKIENLPERLGLAIDLGTTTVGVFLVDMAAGRVLAANAVLNRQAAVGADIIRRLEASAASPDNLSRLAVESIMNAVSGLINPKAVEHRIEKAVVVGNTAMHHLLLRLDVGKLMVIPFQPAKTEPAIIEGFFPDIGNSVEVRFPALIGGFVGSDALACCVYFGLGKIDAAPALAIDLGTNGEVLLCARGKILASSTAAGPAFEGVNISCGMRATYGAVVAADWQGDDLILKTIGKTEPKGLAGSGLLSVARRLRDRGIIEPSGRIIDPERDVSGRVFRNRDGKAVRLDRNLSLTQGDIRELQKAKGAIRACADTLIDMLGLSNGEIERIYLTGSFGGRIDVEDAIELGVLPRVDASKIKSISNGAGLGAAMMLDEKEFDRACRLAKQIEHVELFSSPEFIDRYVEAMSLA